MPKLGAAPSTRATCLALLLGLGAGGSDPAIGQRPAAPEPPLAPIRAASSGVDSGLVEPPEVAALPEPARVAYRAWREELSRKGLPPFDPAGRDWDHRAIGLDHWLAGLAAAARTVPQPSDEELAAAAAALPASPEPRLPEKRWKDEDLIENLDLLRRLSSVEATPAEQLGRYSAALAIPGERAGELPEAATVWQPIGSGMRSLYLSSFGTYDHRSGRMKAAQYAYDPSLGTTTLFLGAAAGGIWRFASAGPFGFWEPRSDKLPAEQQLGAMWVDPANANRMLLGAGDLGHSNGKVGTGIWRSVDGGATWTLGNMSPTPSYILRIVQDRMNPEIVLAVGLSTLAEAPSQAAGIFRSIDFGLNWTQVYSGRVTDLAQSENPPFPHYWYAGAPGVGVLESSNNGLSFHPINGNGGTGLLGVEGRVSLTISKSNPNIQYALISLVSNGSLFGVFRSTNWGYNWVPITTTDDFSWNTGAYTGGIAVDPSDPNRLVVGMGTALYSYNAATSDPLDVCWRAPGFDSCGGALRFWPGHADNNGFVFVPQSLAPGSHRVLILNDGGYYLFDLAAHTMDGGGNLLGLNTGQQWPLPYGALATSRSDPDVAIASLYDNGAMRIDLAASSVVRGAASEGDGSHTSISPDDTARAYVGFGAPFQRRFSNDGGLTYPDLLVLDPPLGGSSPGNAETLADPAPNLPPATVTTYSGQNLFTRKADLTDSWTQANAGVVTPAGTSIEYFDQAHNRISWLYYSVTAQNHRLYVTSGSTLGALTTVDRTPTPLPGSTLNDALAFADRSSFAAETVYYVTGRARPSRALVSRNQGICWEEVTGELARTLPNVTFHELVGHPVNRNLLFLATQVGIFRSDNRGKTWSRYMNGLPAIVDVGSVDLRYDGMAQPELWISTDGRGWWRRTVDSARDAASLLFRDGFESGSKSQWTPPSCP